jgi:phospholysine phosphohistidine inorganic pyrophosphate phosphatase
VEPGHDEPGRQALLRSLRPKGITGSAGYPGTPFFATVGIKGLLIDLDGTLYVEGEPVPGCREALTKLRSSGLLLRFVTNTTRKPRREVLLGLRRMGFEAEEAEIFTPARAAALVLRNRRCYPLVADSLLEDLEGVVPDDESPEYVLVGDLGEGFTYARLNATFRHLMGGAELLALQKNRYWRRENGLSLDAGPFVAALEYASGKTAAVVGKPEKEFFRLALKDIGDLKTQEIAMVGDDPEADVTGAKDAGLKGVQVKTGKYVADAEIGGGADLVLESFAGLPEALGL